MAEILMVDGRGLLIARVGHVLDAAMMLPEAASEILFLFFVGVFFSFGFVFCGFWVFILFALVAMEEEAISRPVLRRSG
jgi:hypothetical protein